MSHLQGETTNHQAATGYGSYEFLLSMTINSVTASEFVNSKLDYSLIIAGRANRKIDCASYNYKQVWCASLTSSIRSKNIQVHDTNLSAPRLQYISSLSAYLFDVGLMAPQRSC